MPGGISERISGGISEETPREKLDGTHGALPESLKENQMELLSESQKKNPIRIPGRWNS